MRRSALRSTAGPGGVLATALTALFAGGCGDDIKCGPQTINEDGTCVAIPVLTQRCGPGTVAMNGECVPTGPMLSCGSGTREMNGACVPTFPEVMCGEGTVDAGDG